MPFYELFRTFFKNSGVHKVSGICGLSNNTLIDYLDKIYIIHLPGRDDRYAALCQELKHVGIDINHEKVSIPDAPIVTDADGFTSASVRGNFLSHLDILRDARDKAFDTIMVLEDDAIFRLALRKTKTQERLVGALKSIAGWGICNLGHPLTHELHNRAKGLIPYDQHFIWAHCYLVHNRCIDSLVDYFEETLISTPDYARGYKMYIDGAFNRFVDYYPQWSRLVANPSLSAQRGSVSSIASRRSYDKFQALAPLLQYLRAIRDYLWRLRVPVFVVE